MEVIGRPATAAEAGVWFMEQAGVAGLAYTLGLTVSFGPGLDVNALLSACRAVLDRHPVLRGAIEDRDGLPWLVPAREQPVVRHVERVSAVEEMARGFALDTGPLCRFAVATGERPLLVFTAHHSVFDGHSKDVLVRDLAAFYRKTPLAPLPEPRRPPPTAAREFRRTRPHRATEFVAGPGEEWSGVLTREASARLDVVADGLGVTRFELLLSAFRFVAGGLGDLTIALSTRTPGESDHIGLFVNELPLPCATPHDVPVLDQVRAVRRDLRALYPFRATPLSGARPSLSPTAISLSYRRRVEPPSFADSRVDWTTSTGIARNLLHLTVVDGPTTVGKMLHPRGTRAPVEEFTEALRDAIGLNSAEPLWT
ncbi:condensation domain-containing protein [Umezawaea endophytica]|uniref:Condensation domain-containing protein n=1 Tax=Umezawaea endophytica TaxID=1654476 RepID=A0A9X3AIF1_9PSEU|nr:condensation domain-containing protein [Umezawaea endophytica]MCS7482431.1 condensation domain-containing protein [Umezawaea endophytica]